MQKIDLEKQGDFFRGCASPGVRMSDDLLEFYNGSEASVIRARSASGVCIAMVTDAVEAEYSVSLGGYARKIFTTDIVVDGVRMTVDGEGPHKLRFSPGEKTVVFHLPHLVVINKIALAVNEGAFAVPAPGKKRKLLLCGDSIFQGMTCSTPAGAVGVLLAERVDAELHNTSVGGAEMRVEPVAHTIALGGEILVVGFGINDAFGQTEKELFRERTHKVLTLMERFSGKAFIVVPIPCLKVDPAVREAYCSMIREEQKSFPGVTLIEGADFYPADERFFADGTHPNDEGMKIYADGLAEIISSALR